VLLKGRKSEIAQAKLVVCHIGIDFPLQDPFHTLLAMKAAVGGEYHLMQYTAVTFGNRCRQAGVRPSMGSVGDAYDNAMCESFFATLECELLDRVRLRTPEEAEQAVFEFIEGWYNTRRRHSALNYHSPIEYESKHLSVAQDTSPDLSTETG